MRIGDFNSTRGRWEFTRRVRIVWEKAEINFPCGAGSDKGDSAQKQAPGANEEPSEEENKKKNLIAKGARRQENTNKQIGHCHFGEKEKMIPGEQDNFDNRLVQNYTTTPSLSLSEKVEKEIK